MPTTPIYTLSLHDALPIFSRAPDVVQSVIIGHIVPSTHDPHLAVMDDRCMISPRRPGSIRRDLLPLLAIGRRPNVVLEAPVIAEVVVFRAAEDPHAPVEDQGAGGEARAPASLLRYLL